MKIDIVYDLGDGVIKDRTMECSSVEIDMDGLISIDGTPHRNAVAFKAQEVSKKE